MKDWIMWVDPFDETNEIEFHCIHEKSAIEWAKKAAKRSNHVYDSDEQALDDFIVTNWAWKVEKPEIK